jgi:hypothetical protein
MKNARRPFSMVLLALLSCVPAQPDPTAVVDLRVLGMSFEPPEIMIPCDARLLLGLASAGADGGTITLDPALQAQLAAFASRPVQFTTLIADPAGNGRQLAYNALACAKTNDRACDDEGQFVSLKNGQTTAGELAMQVTPGAQFLTSGNPLLLDVVVNDTFKGLGGIRLPVVLDLQSLDKSEHIYAQKLMVYACRFFPSQKVNVTPVLPGVTWNGEAWPEGEVKQASGTTAVKVAPVDFSMLEEDYVVPSIMLTPVALHEAWKINWLTSMGVMSSYETGGTDFSGGVGGQDNTWKPDPTATTEQDVTFTFVVRDGRGGESWLTRTAHWTP